jgi:hypothetical protein
MTQEGTNLGAVHRFFAAMRDGADAAAMAAFHCDDVVQEEFPKRSSRTVRGRAAGGGGSRQEGDVVASVAGLPPAGACTLMPASTLDGSSGSISALIDTLLVGGEMGCAKPV